MSKKSDDLFAISLKFDPYLRLLCGFRPRLYENQFYGFDFKF